MALYSKLDRQQWLILILAFVTAGIHMALGDPLFILNGIGYIGLTTLYFVKFNFIPLPRSFFRWVLAGYAALTIILYIVMQVQSGGEYVSALGILTKVIELVLIFLLIREPV